MKDKKYILLYNEVKQQILTGKYKSTNKLPSKRIMADMFSCSTVTVENAYRMLADEGYIVSKEKSGYFVRSISLPEFSVSESQASSLVLLPKDTVSPAAEDFECSLWFKTLRKVMSEYDRELFAKSPSKGCSILRNAIAEYLLRYRGMYAPPERIVIGSGSEQLYGIAIRILGTDKVYGIENPCYRQIKEVYSGYGVKLCELDMAQDGISDKALSDAKIDVLHVTPFHSYPTGVTAGISKRYAYLSKMYSAGGYVIEDDFDSEFYIPKSPIESLYSLDKAGKVIYINTFSKSLSPSFRMGYMILPEGLDKLYESTVGRYSCTVPVLEQYALAEFISSGSFERHLNRMRKKRG